MSQQTQALLMLMVPLKLEALMVDILLQETAISGFTSNAVNGHGHFTNIQLSVAEQVSGRQRRVQFMVYADLSSLQALLAKLKIEFADADLHFVLQPVLDAGTL